MEPRLDLMTNPVAIKIAKRFANLGMVPKSNTPAELAALIKVEAATWGPIIRSTGFKPLE